MGAGDWARTVEWAAPPLVVATFTQAQAAAGVGSFYCADFEVLMVTSAWATGGPLNSLFLEFFDDQAGGLLRANPQWFSSGTVQVVDRCPVYGRYVRPRATTSGGAPGAISVGLLPVRGQAGASQATAIFPLIAVLPVALAAGATSSTDPVKVRGGNAMWTVDVPAGGTWDARLMARFGGADNFVVASMNSADYPNGGTIPVILPRQEVRNTMHNGGAGGITYAATLITEQ